MNHTVTTLALVCLTFSSACEPELPQPNPPVAEPLPETPLDAGSALDAGVPPSTPPRITTQRTADAFVSQANAMDAKSFAAFDLDRGVEMPFESNGWDLAFQRFHIRARGGASGDGGVQVAPLRGVEFDSVTTAPATGFLEDQPDGPDENSDPDTVFGSAAPWYSYNVMTHVLSPTSVVYVVRSDLGAFFKVRVENYYDRAGTPANLTIRWEQIAAPSK